jgi:hypothetical protein
MKEKRMPKKAKGPSPTKKWRAETKRKGAGKQSTATRKSRPATGKPALLSGGNPQIAKGDGDAPVRAYLAAMSGWKREVGWIP